MSEPIKQICRSAKITDYLAAKGVELIRCGNRYKGKCKCPLPEHEDKTPSFYITETPDGREVFKCWGCKEWGDIIDLIHLMEKKGKGEILRTLAKSHNVELGKFEIAHRAPPTNEDVISIFVLDEDRIAKKITMWAQNLIETHGGSNDIVDKVSLMYQHMDSLLEKGDYEGLKKVFNTLKRLMKDYES